MKESYAQFLKVLLSEFVDPSKGRRMSRDAPAEEGDYMIIPGIGGRKVDSQKTDDKKAKDEKEKAEKESEKESDKAAKDDAERVKSGMEKYLDAVKRASAGGGRTYAKIATDPIIRSMRSLAAGSSGRRSGPVI